MSNRYPWPHPGIATPTARLTEADLDACIGTQAWPPRRAAAPGPVEIEPSNYPVALQQAADEQAQHRTYMRQQAQAGSAEGCADCEDGEPRRQRIPEGGGFIVALCIVGAIAAMVLLTHWAATAARAVA